MNHGTTHFYGYPFVIVIAILNIVLILYIFAPALKNNNSESCRFKEEIIFSGKNKEKENDNDNNSIPLLSIIIPAYNEEDRICIMLDAALESLHKHRSRVIEKAQQAISTENNNIFFEWIIVSDGSTDKTEAVVKNYANTKLAKNNNNDTWKLVTLRSNCGKGAAVRTGMLRAKGAIRLMVDADGATDFDALSTLLSKLNSSSSSIIFGSRAHLASTAKRSMIRTILMHSFHLCVSTLIGTNVRDTQCGFKLFTSHAAEQIFANLHLQRWAFDIEIVVLASIIQKSSSIEEVGVPWHEVEGSKLDSSKLQLAIVSLGMLRDMLCVRLCYSLGIWNVTTEEVVNNNEQSATTNIVLDKSTNNSNKID